MSRVIGVSSGKGGVGKTTCTINLGAALASLGKSVAIVDASLTTPDISLHLGIPFHMHSLSHVLQGNSHIHAATFNHKSGVRIIPGNIHVDMLKEFEGENFGQVIRDLSDNHEFILVDCAAGLGRETISALRHCTEAIVVANPDLPSVVNAAKTLRVCEEISCKPIGVILNKTSSKQQLSEEKIRPLFNRNQIIGKVSEDKKFNESLKAAEVLFLQHSGSKPAQQFLNMANDLVDHNRRGKVIVIPAIAGNEHLKEKNLRLTRNSVLFERQSAKITKKKNKIKLRKNVTRKQNNGTVERAAGKTKIKRPGYKSPLKNVVKRKTLQNIKSSNTVKLQKKTKKTILRKISKSKVQKVGSKPQKPKTSLPKTNLKKTIRKKTNIQKRKSILDTLRNRSKTVDSSTTKQRVKPNTATISKVASIKNRIRSIFRR